MKKTYFSFLLFCVVSLFTWAAPADPTPYKYIQPDGSVIVLQNHGDEFFHWKTDEAGRVVEKGADGFYRPVDTNLAAGIANANRIRSDMYAAWSSYDNPPVTNFGDRKVLCILANFFDIRYTVEDPNTHFTSMLNQSGYSLNGSIGSVRDYFVENSLGQYRPQFDVYGPVDLSQTSAYYDSEGVHLAILEAYELLAEVIPINDYDTDNNGTIDMVLFYFPGYNEAEGGPENTIWPKQSSGYFGNLGEKRFVRYFCTSEFRGNSGAEPASIGTTCHEFAHSLGLPDFYDVDYAGSGGQNTTTGSYDLMASGNYNDRGRKPPYLSALERNMLGWMPAPAGIASPGNYSLQAVQNNVAYRLDSSVPGEYFILESRNADKWDSPLFPGLLVYHIDKSDRIVDVENGYSAAYLWENTNSINNYFGHPCYYIVPTSDSAQYWEQYIFPGNDNVTTFVPMDWTGDSIGVSLTDIAHNGTESTFTLNLSNRRMVFGKVTDTDGNPLKDVLVSLTPSTDAFAAAPALISTSISCMTDDEGNYSLELENDATVYQILMAQITGYTSMYFNLTISSLFTERNITLLRNGEGEPIGLYKYDPNAFYSSSWGFGTNTDVAVSMRFTATELAERNAVGALLEKVTFYSGADNGESVYVVVDIGNDIKLRKDVTNQYEPYSFVTIDVSDDNIIIPEGKDIYIGYGIKAVSTQFPFPAFGPFTEDYGGLYRCYGFLTGKNWSNFVYNNSYYAAIISAEFSTTVDIEFSTLGVSYIKVEDGVPVVRVAAGKSLKSTAWYLDGNAVETPPAINDLASGSHTYMVSLTYYDGTSERVYYEVDN